MAYASETKLFHFRVTNCRTKESAVFIGQGETVKEAFADGVKNCADPYRANSSGKKTHEHGLAVELPEDWNGGSIVHRTLREFESSKPYLAQQEGKP